MMKQNIIAFITKDKGKAIAIGLIALLLFVLPLLPVPVAVLRGSTFIGLLMPMLLYSIVYFFQIEDKEATEIFLPKKNFLKISFGIEAIYYAIFVIARLIQYNQENKSAVYVASSIICFSLAIFASNILWALGVSDFLTWGIGLILLIIDNVFAPADRTIAGASWLGGFISSISFLHNFWVNVLVGLGLILIATLINICLVKVMEGKQLNAFIVKITNSQILIK